MCVTSNFGLKYTTQLCKAKCGVLFYCFLSLNIMYKIHNKATFMVIEIINTDKPNKEVKPSTFDFMFVEPKYITLSTSFKAFMFISFIITIIIVIIIYNKSRNVNFKTSNAIDDNVNHIQTVMLRRRFNL